jgi:hypothetical protein
VQKKIGFGKRAPRVALGQRILELPTEVRLALEMAAHEDSERRALEGELHVLEEAWREAEEIAGIADDLLVPAPQRAQLASLKNNASE